MDWKRWKNIGQKKSATDIKVTVIQTKADGDNCEQSQIRRDQIVKAEDKSVLTGNRTAGSGGQDGWEGKQF